MRKLKKGDSVMIIAGKDKGKTGSILRFVGVDRVVVQGINSIKKHEKPNPSKGITGGIIAKEASVHISNVAIYNYVSKKADKVGFMIDDDKNKYRVFKSTGESIEV
jgi:large subunit ribosomal protein L24